MKTLFIASVIVLTYFATLIQARGLIPIKETIPDDIREEYKANITKNIVRGRIHYGLRAQSGQFPYLAWLHILSVTSGYSMCGATLISPDFVITAAHCLNFEFRAIDFWIGSIDKNAFPTFRKGQDYAIYPLYGAPESINLEHDIALISLASSVVAYTPAKLPTRASTSISYEGTQLISAGWGQTELGEISQFLLWTTLIGRPISECGTKRIGTNLICARGTGNSRSGPGDSGGPLLDGNTLIGVVSFIIGDHNGFTRVDKYLDWISILTGISGEECVDEECVRNLYNELCIIMDKANNVVSSS